MIADMLHKDILVPDHPQLTGALGAALIAVDR
jgi:activator of 2-hydroxyglutaryl-CoA dehydratase